MSNPTNDKQLEELRDKIIDRIEEEWPTHVLANKIMQLFLANREQHAAEKVREARIAGAKAYKDTLQSRMVSAYENNVTIKEMEDWFKHWTDGQQTNPNQGDKSE